MATLYPLIIGRHAVLAAEHYLSAAAGARMFAAGGNAIDAAVAATFVEGVVNPHLHTIGGEAPMLIYWAEARRVISVNGNMAAPRRATISHYQNELKLDLVPGEGLLAAGVPAALHALLTALARFGTLTLAEVLEPALALCEEGFPMHPGLSGDPASADQLGGAGAAIALNARKFVEQWPSSGRLYMPGGKVPAPGDIIRNPALAKCLRRLIEAEAAAGRAGREAALAAAIERFYRGDIAREIVEWSRAGDGLLEAEDLASFATRLEEPLAVDYRGARVFKCRPWSQGPVFLQQLRLLEGFDLRAMGHNSTDYIHTLVEASKLAFADREAYYADPQFVPVPIEGLLSTGYAEVRRALIDSRRASMEQRPGDPVRMRALGGQAGPARSWGGGTIHVAAADRRGNMIAVTASGAWIASSPVIEALGFPLGSRMQTFYLDERHPNALSPGKRPRTTLSPTIALRDDQPYLAFGTPGGDQQDQWSLQFFLNVIDFGMDLQEAIEAPKFSTGHFPSSFYPHSASPGLLRLESRIAEPVREELSARGHTVKVQPPYSEGRVLAVEVDRERASLRAAADPRGQLSVLMPAQAVGW